MGYSLRLRAAATLAIATAALALAACVMAELGPHGRPVVHVDGITPGGAFDEAYAKCPGGYDVLEALKRSTPSDYTMKVECR